MSIEFSMNPEELSTAGRAIAKPADDASAAAMTLAGAAADSHDAAANHELSDAFSAFGSVWSADAWGLCTGLQELGDAVAGAASTGSAADHQSAADLSPAVSGSESTHAMVLKSINAF